MRVSASVHRFTVLVSVVAFALFAANPVGAATIHVPADFATIQLAIDAATDGDQIIVAPGTYNETIDLLGKTITLRSARGPDVTIIDASDIGGSVITISSGEGPDTLIEGITITGGTGTLAEVAPGVVDLHGGGLYVTGSNPTIAECIITSNTAARGGGLYLSASAATLIDCMVSDNQPPLQSPVWWMFRGGGMHMEAGSDALISNCTFMDNVSFFQPDSKINAAGAGGGVSILDSSPTFVECTFEGNNAVGGGGMSIASNSNAQLTGCHFTSNWAYYIDTGHSAGWGGGVSVNESNPTFTACVFEANWSESGGAMRNVGSSPVVEECLFVNNEAIGFDWGRGGAVLNRGNSSPEFINSHFVNNTASGLDSMGGAIANVGFQGPSHATVTGCTFEANASPAGGAIGVGSWQSSVAVTESVFLANTASWLGGAIRTENVPENLVIEGATFCHNQPEHISGDWTDAGGNAFLPPADLNCDGVVGVSDLLTLLGTWGECDNPGSGGCPADLNGDGVVNVTDLLLLLANWG